MDKSTAEVLEAAMALSTDQRVEMATQLLRSAGTEEAARLSALREDVTAGFQQVDAGDGIEVPLENLRAFIHELGDDAANRITHKQA
jgi:hypothetical protein